MNLLCLHGLGCSKEDFRGAGRTDSLRPYNIVTFDFPGCGGSPYPDDRRLGMKDLVEITDAVVEELDLKDLVLLGHSMGAVVGLLYIEEHGDRVKGFINTEGNLVPEDCFISRRVVGLSFDRFMKEILEPLSREMAESDNPAFRRYAKTLHRGECARAVYDYSPSLVDYSDNGDLLRRFVNIAIPRLFIYGSDNRGRPCVHRLVEKGVDVAEIQGSGHFPFHDNPEAYYNVIAHFMEFVSL